MLIPSPYSSPFTRLHLPFYTRIISLEPKHVITLSVNYISQSSHIQHSLKIASTEVQIVAEVEEAGVKQANEAQIIQNLVFLVAGKQEAIRSPNRETFHSTSSRGGKLIFERETSSKQYHYQRRCKWVPLPRIRRELCPLKL